MEINIRLRRVLVLFLFLCTVSALRIIGNPFEIQAAPKSISKSDFVLTENGEKIDFIEEIENSIEVEKQDCYRYDMSEREAEQWINDNFYFWKYYIQYSPEQIKKGNEQSDYTFARGIKFGDKATTVAKKYGKTKKIKIEMTDDFNNCMLISYTKLNAKDLSYYYEYKLKKTKYAIRFYFTSKGILQNVVYLYDVKNFKAIPYHDGGRLPVIVGGNQVTKKKHIAGRTYYEIPRDAIIKNWKDIKFFNEHYKVTDCEITDMQCNIFIYDPKGDYLYKNKWGQSVQEFFDGETSLIDALCIEYIDLEYDADIAWSWVKKTLANPDQYLYISIYIIDKDAGCNKHSYAFNFKLV